jgi:hypothetical protein
MAKADKPRKTKAPALRPLTTPEASERPAAPPPPAVSLATKLGTSLGIVLAMVLAALLNVLVTRHYTRWDWTSGGSFTLSPATLTTLHGLAEPLRIHVVLSSDDPLRISVAQLLESYRAETTHLDVDLVDPDRDVAEFLALRERYQLVPGRTEDGRIVTDASIIVAQGERRYFLTGNDLVKVEDEEDMTARPRLEQALTGAIRAVTKGEAPRICFSSGHGEPTLDRGGPEGLGALGDRLAKNNYETTTVPPFKESRNAEPWKGCAVLVVPGPTEKVPAEDIDAMRRFIEAGGSALVTVGPQPNDAQDGYLELGLDPLLALAGVELGKDFVFEVDPRYRPTQGLGETFTPLPRAHAITDGLLRAAERDTSLAVVLTVASSLRTKTDAQVPPTPLLVTSDASFGMAKFLEWAQNPSEPKLAEGDTKGPLTVAVAAEHPQRVADAAHGARVVVVSSSSAVFGANWQNTELRATALFIESAISWLASAPPNLDIPNKPVFTAGLRLSDDDLAAVFRYVVVVMPLSAALMGLAVALRRRGSERKKPAKAAEG